MLSLLLGGGGGTRIITPVRKKQNAIHMTFAVVSEMLQ